MNRTLRVLNIEDSKRDVELLRRHLSRSGYEITLERVETPASMKAALEAREWDVILCDYSMPHFSALRALALLKETELDIPFIIISGTIGEAIAVEAMRAGANDYLMKDNLARLAPAIERERHDAGDRRARQRAEQALKDSEAELRALFAALTDVIFVLDSEGRYLKVAPTDPTYLYRPSAESLGRTVHEVFAKEKADFFLTHIRRALDEGRMHRVEYCLQMDEKEVWFDGSVSPISEDSVVWIARDITERKRAEEALRESEERYKGLVDSAFDGVVIHQDRIIISANRAYAEMFGYTIKKLIGRNILELTPPEFRDFVSAQIMRDEAVYETLGLKEDGFYINIEVSAKMCLYQGAPARLAAVRNITERKRTEEELRRQLDFTEAITTSLGEGVYALDKSGRVTFMNPAAESALGWKQAELLGREMHDVIHFQLADGTLRSSAECPPLRVLKSGRAVEVESDAFTRRDGSVFLTAYTSSPIVTDGQVRGAVLAFRDITERKRAEEALRASEERYRLLFDSNPQPMWVFDLETLAFLEINQAAIEHYGYSREEFLAMTIRDIRPASDVPNLLDRLSQEALPINSEAEVWKHRKKDGKTIDVEIAGHALTFYGRPARIVLAYDVTERKSLEAQLRQAQKMEAVGQLAGGIAHDFNNLLTAILGYSDLTIAQLARQDPMLRNVEEIKKAGERAAALTRQLLAFSRKQVLQPKVIDLNSVVSNLERMLQRVIGEDVELRTLLDPNLGRIKVDPGQIEQIIMNLAVNARDAMPQGGKLTIETKNICHGDEYSLQHVGVNLGSFVMLAVSDTGAGMDLVTQARIFEPFFTTKELGKGTGLGLSTVYGIVKQSGGNIWTYSELGVGTTFKTYFPRTDEGAREYERCTGSGEVLHGTETILLAEDEQLVLKLACEVLRMYDYEVLEATNGDAALLICERFTEPIHLLITDVIMPGMNGHELSDRLRHLRPEMKALYMSGYTDGAIVHHEVLADGANFIQKPFSADSLARKVREILDAPSEA
jgi:two-component system cell cycle sensor histidine kinase/response regulator CckA